ncbi:TPA: threonylcarbamoyl-AMP synthase [Streptococcus suis]|nr:threonylcarbamoyl-AMP synthase [Streptococcus suis]HEM4407079.1 threonylcarbamoyl-AMP synthase [Streptococcus suis]HEM4538912.1 threonylcarbamoyl-AMP synthase [Streptococcus suis]HEM4648835.1 threonylcarbamoyl-AMP synthase [Streptococcus suis]
MTMDKLRTILENGGAVILPTETVYGLFAQALNEDAVNRVYQLKQRPRDKAMNLNVSNLNDIYFFSQNTPFFLEKLYNRFMPGPLTIILKANENVPFWVNSGLDTVGFRLPNHEQTLRLISETGPLIGPSANISGNESGKKFSDIQAQFSVDLPGIEDDQALTGIDSTILDLSVSGQKARILRQGAISREEIQKAIPEIEFEVVL